MKYTHDWASRMAHRAAASIIGSELTQYAQIHQAILDTITSEILRRTGDCENEPMYSSGIPGAVVFTINDVIDEEQRSLERASVQQAKAKVFNAHVELIREYLAKMRATKRVTAGHRVEYTYKVADVFDEVPPRRILTELVFGTQYAFERAGFNCVVSTAASDRSREGVEARTEMRDRGEQPIPDLLRVTVAW